jgi:hypothetical protein
MRANCSQAYRYPLTCEVPFRRWALSMNDQSNLILRSISSCPASRMHYTAEPAGYFACTRIIAANTIGREHCSISFWCRNIYHNGRRCDESTARHRLAVASAPIVSASDILLSNLVVASPFCIESTVPEFGIIIYSNLLFLIQCLRTPKSESKVTTLVAIMFWTDIRYWCLRATVCELRGHRWFIIATALGDCASVRRCRDPACCCCAPQRVACIYDLVLTQ